MKKLKFELDLEHEALTKEQMQQIEGGCSVSCLSGYYACCNDANCNCVQSGSDLESTVCNSGGPGASSCST